MKKLLLVITMLISLVNAQVIPGINSKGGAMVLPEGKLKMGIKHIYFERKNMYDGSSQVDNLQGLDAKANITLLGIKYGLAKDLDLKVAIPYKQINATATLPNKSVPAQMQFPVEIDNEGLGDMVLMLRYQIMNMDKYGFALSIGGGIKLPTGSSDERFKKAPPINPSMNTPMPTQLGTDEFEYKAEIGFSKLFTNTMRVDSNLMYTYRPKAKNDYDFGNELSFDIGLISEITKNINLGIEYNGKYNTATDSGNDPEPAKPFPFKAFSGTVGYITPQIEWLPFDKPKVHIGVGVSFLANYDLKDYQPVEKRRFIVRIGYMF